MLNCRQVLAELSNYVDGDVTPEVREALERHLARCLRCWMVFSTLRRSLDLVLAVRPGAAPRDVSERLHARLREVYRAKES
jgi:anti-sigma factor RsiW